VTHEADFCNGNTIDSNHAPADNGLPDGEVLTQCPVRIALPNG
jgi:hypothetical protein